MFAEVACWIVPTFLALLTGWIPCKPPFLSSLIFCHEKYKYSVIRLAIVLFEFSLWHQFVLGAAIYIFNMVVSLSFLWLQVDSHVKSIGHDFGSYRKLQVLEKIINSFMRNRLLPLFAWMYPIFEIILLYIVIKLFHSTDSDSIKILMFAFMYFGVTVFTVGIFSAAAKVHNLSKEWIKWSKQGCKNKMERRIHKSIIPLRLYFGNNYVDTLTPCVIQDFCARQTASLLLLGKK
jgi:hypothetical protein